MRIAVMDKNETDGARMAALIRDACCQYDVKIAEYSDGYSFTRAFQETGFDLLFVAVYGIRDFEAAWKIRDMDRRVPIMVICVKHDTVHTGLFSKCRRLPGLVDKVVDFVYRQFPA